MDNLENFLEGKKTFIGALIVGLAGILRVFSIITPDQEESIRGIGMGIAMFGLYSMFKREIKK